MKLPFVLRSLIYFMQIEKMFSLQFSSCRRQTILKQFFGRRGLVVMSLRVVETYVVAKFTLLEFISTFATKTELKNYLSNLLYFHFEFNHSRTNFHA